MQPRTLGPYTIHERIGQGTFGRVYTCGKPHSSKRLVVKVIDVTELDDGDREGCLTEVKVLAKLGEQGCRYIVEYVESFVDQGCLCMVMEHARGGTLQQKLASLNPNSLPEHLFWSYFTQIAVGLETVHAHGILHRDLKTANIFLTQTGTGVKLGDFGLARILSSSTSMAKSIVGTPYYLSPEMCNGVDYNEKSDIWALGVISYQMATANLPFKAPNQASLILQIVKARVSGLSGIKDKYGSEAVDLITKCLTKNQTRRPDATQLLSIECVSVALKKYGVGAPAPKKSKTAYQDDVCKQIRAHPLTDSTARLSTPNNPSAVPNRRLRKNAPRPGPVVRTRVSTSVPLPSTSYKSKIAREKDINLVESLPDSVLSSDDDREPCRADVVQPEEKTRTQTQPQPPSVTWSVKSSEGREESTGTCIQWAMQDTAPVPSPTAGSFTEQTEHRAVLLGYLETTNEQLAEIGCGERKYGEMVELLGRQDSEEYTTRDMAPDEIRVMRLVYNKMLLEAELEEMGGG